MKRRLTVVILLAVLGIGPVSLASTSDGSGDKYFESGRMELAWFKSWWAGLYWWGIITTKSTSDGSGNG